MTETEMAEETPTEPLPTEPLDPLAEMKELLQRTQANFENYRKQTEKRLEEFREFATKNLILQILPVLDNFERALNSKEVNPADFIHGIELIYSQLFSILEEQGIKPIAIENGKFDPYHHEPLLKVESDLPEGTIIEELQKGYTLHGIVLRPAKVKVSAGKNNH